MSDFLSNLVARSVPTAPQLTPRLPSLFEPADPFESAPGAPDADDADVLDETTPTTPSALPALEESRRALSSLPATTAAPYPPTAQPPPQPRTDLSRAPRETSRWPGAPVTSATPSAAVRRGRPLLVQPAGGVDRPARVVDTVAAPAPVAVISMALPDPASRRRPADLTAPESASAPLERPVPAPPPPIEKPRESLPHLRQPVRGADQPLVPYEPPLAPLLGSVAPPSPTHGPVHADPPPVPQVIQVTIGRVEVRATLPVPPPARELRRPAVMPLDEYLRERRGGG